MEEFCSSCFSRIGVFRVEHGCVIQQVSQISMTTLIEKGRSKMRRRVLPLINYISQLYQLYGG
jgi:hypothetical protein